MPPESPFTIDVVVERLFTFLDQDELRKCRTVCRMWLREANRALDRRHSRTIVTENDLLTTLNLLKRKDCTISTLVIDNKDVRFVDNRFRLGDECFMNLFRQVAPTLLSLSLQYVQCHQDVYTKIMRLFGKYNWLRKLELGTLKINEEDYVRLFPVRKEGSDEFLVFTRVKFLEYMDYSTYIYNRNDVSCLASTVGRMFPNLEQINIFCLSREKPSNFDNIKFPGIKGMRVIMHGNDAPHQTYTGMTNIGLKCLMNMGLTSLESFELYNIVPQCTMLGNFLESRGDTLRSLTLIQSKMLEVPLPGLALRLSDEIVPSPFPLKLPNLKSLHTTKSFVRNLNDILVSTPALKYLYLDFEFGQNFGTILPAKLVPPSSLKHIGFNWIDTASFRKLTPFFVNQITSLEITDCFDNLVEIIVENFLNLKQLVLAEKSAASGAKSLTDAPFTGMDAKTLKGLHRRWFERAHRKGKYPTITKENMKEIGKIRKGSPNLSNLTKLEILILRFIEPSNIRHWIFWPFWDLKYLSTVMVSGLKMTKEILHVMHVGNGFICSGPYPDFLKLIMSTQIKFYDDGNMVDYSFVRRVEVNEEEKQDEGEDPDSKDNSNVMNDVYDALEEAGSSVDMDFSKSVMPVPLPPVLPTRRPKGKRTSN